MREQAFRFGRARHLVGIAGLPDSGDGTVGVILLNAGLVHRVGPFRLHVDLTRRLNALGYPTLRFDLSTIGDSGATGESQSRNQQICADVDDAMALLGQHSGCQRFVLVGLCSGAEKAHNVAREAHSHEKLAGAIFLDNFAYRTLGFRVRHYLPRMFNVRRWKRWLARKAQEHAAGDVPVFGVAPLPQHVVREDLGSMVARGLKLDLVYTGGIHMYFNHHRQFRECFGSVVDDPAVSTRYLRETDHTYVLTGDRQRLIDHIGEWLTRHFPIAQAGALP
ncbi:alpha/beta hydrolase [Dyella solisilvae]|uniref:Alpha/beta hydrolase n=1 Tax=Dyella solisilvae TaxID=1920168 RepID=A0A370K316_9GAMM|nr:alpha/beta hydrolase [Dyella solisilvae]RDI97041.1 alpha/beta hydrolase [Dyella solisilvae]